MRFDFINRESLKDGIIISISVSFLLSYGEGSRWHYNKKQQNEVDQSVDSRVWKSWRQKNEWVQHMWGLLMDSYRVRVRKKLNLIPEFGAIE